MIRNVGKTRRVRRVIIMDNKDSKDSSHDDREVLLQYNFIIIRILYL